MAPKNESQKSGVGKKDNVNHYILLSLREVVYFNGWTDRYIYRSNAVIHTMVSVGIIVYKC